MASFTSRIRAKTARREARSLTTPMAMLQEERLAGFLDAVKHTQRRLRRCNSPENDDRAA